MKIGEILSRVTDCEDKIQRRKHNIFNSLFKSKTPVSNASEELAELDRLFSTRTALKKVLHQANFNTKVEGTDYCLAEALEIKKELFQEKTFLSTVVRKIEDAVGDGASRGTLVEPSLDLELMRTRLTEVEARFNDISDKISETNRRTHIPL